MKIGRLNCPAGFAATVCLAVASASATDDRVPDGVSASDWASILTAYEAKRHEAFAVEGGDEARNPGQQWRTRFDGRGFEATPDGGGWSWGLELVSYGREGAERNPCRAREKVEDSLWWAGSQPECIETAGGRVWCLWGDALTEWYVNDPRGLEHGYTVHQRPAEVRAAMSTQCSDAARAEAHGTLEKPLTFTQAVRGDLRPQVSGDTVMVGASDEDSSATGVNGNQADNSASNSGAA